jgi:hypothetical protein
MDTLVELLIPVGLICGAFVYPALQYIAARRMGGRWRLWAMLPLGPMGFVLVLTLFALLRESNIWPIPLIFIGPLAVIYLSLLFGVRGLVSK